jgi:hypothetical protein
LARVSRSASIRTLSLLARPANQPSGYRYRRRAEPEPGSACPLS